jgi:hypothetical protein
MTDKIGVLGESSATSAAAAGTTTVYTVPASKAAKVKLMCTAAHGADSLGSLSATVNGAVVALAPTLVSGEFTLSNSTLLFGTTTSAPDGLTAAKTVSPAPFEYYLSAADTVAFTVATTGLVSINFQVVGTEIDV